MSWDGQTGRDRQEPSAVWSGRLRFCREGVAPVGCCCLLRAVPLVNEPVAHTTVAMLHNSCVVSSRLVSSWRGRKRIILTVIYYVLTVRINVIPVLKDDCPLPAQFSHSTASFLLCRLVSSRLVLSRLVSSWRGRKRIILTVIYYVLTVRINVIPVLKDDFPHPAQFSHSTASFPALRPHFPPKKGFSRTKQMRIGTQLCLG
jgi:hypothetical protein